MNLRIAIINRLSKTFRAKFFFSLAKIVLSCLTFEEHNLSVKSNFVPIFQQELFIKLVACLADSGKLQKILIFLHV